MAKSKKSKRNGTKTKSFGVSKRENHDSSRFYSQKLYSNIKNDKKVRYVENPVPDDVINKSHNIDSRDLSLIPDNSIHLMVTSPPYSATKQYDEDLTLKEYLKLLKDVFTEVYRVLVPGGRACINIANLGRKPYIPLHSFIISDMLNIGYLMRGEIIWHKGASAGSCAWGSWKSAANPVLRDIHEYIMIFSKDTLKRPKKDKIDTITRDEFLEYTQSVWTFQPESAKRIGHPAPFPIELPYRLIQLYTFEDDIVLDPFAGSGSTAIAALKSNRNFICCDSKKEYVDLSNKRVKEMIEEMSTVQVGLDKF